MSTLDYRYCNACGNSELTEAIQHLNHNYGRGSVVAIGKQFFDGGGFFTRRVPTSQNGGFEERRKYRVRGRTVFACGHQVTT